MKLIWKRESPDKLEEYLTKAELHQFQQDLKRYNRAYPYLGEPVAQDMLKEAMLIKIQIQRLRATVFSKALEGAELLQARKQLDSAQRTMTLYFTRLGITFTSKQRRKEPKKVRTPIEEQEDEE